MPVGRRLTVLLTGSLIVGVAACSPSTASKLDDAAKAIARSQAVDESEVMTALQRFGSTEDEMLDIAQTWERNLPNQPLPNLRVVVAQADGIADSARRALRASACAAVADVIRRKPVPNGSSFSTNTSRHLCSTKSRTASYLV